MTLLRGGGTCPFRFFEKRVSPDNAVLGVRVLSQNFGRLEG